MIMSFIYCYSIVNKRDATEKTNMNIEEYARDGQINR